MGLKVVYIYFNSVMKFNRVLIELGFSDNAIFSLVCIEKKAWFDEKNFFGLNAYRQFTENSLTLYESTFGRVSWN